MGFARTGDDRATVLRKLPKSTKRREQSVHLLAIDLRFGPAVSRGSNLVARNASASSQLGDSSSQRNDRKANKVAEGLRKRTTNHGGDEDKVNVILQLNGQMSGSLKSFLQSNGVRLKKSFKNFKSSSVELQSSYGRLASYAKLIYQ